MDDLNPWLVGANHWSAFWPITLLLATGATLVVILVGRRLRSVWLTLVITLSVLAAVWLIGDRLQAAGWNDMDGWADCTRCGTWHLVGALTFLAPPLLGVVLVIAVSLDAVIHRATARR